MAGEIDDHIQIQQEYQPSGSISFGRFESETLSWERRSSFSHNRYLEEAEKYSKPGSVTQKKAYFEAQLKRKGPLLHQISPVSHCVSEGGEASRYVNGEQSNYMDEFGGQYDGDEPLHEFQNHANDGVLFCWYDESPVLSDGIKEEEVDGEGEDLTFTSQPTSAPIASEATATMDLNCQNGSCAEMDGAQEGDGDVSLMANDTVQTLVESEAADDEVVTESVSSFGNKKDALNLDSQVEKNGKSHSKSTTKTLKMEKVITEQKTAKSALKAKPSSSSQTLQRSSSDKKSTSPVSSSRKNGRNTASGISSKAKIDIQSDSRTSVSKRRKPKGSQNANANGGQDNDGPKNGQKDVKSKRGVGITSSESIPGRHLTSAIQSSNRPKKVMDSVRSHLKTATTVFSFKSDERAEKRKEFYAKLDQKQHSKEVRVNGTSAKSQEEKEARMKQFRRSHSFKATPMPSFYNENGAKGAMGKKAPAKYPTSRGSHRSPSNKITPCSSSPTVSRADRGTAAETCPPTSENNMSGLHRPERSGKPGEFREAAKSKKIEKNRRDERSKGKHQVSSPGDGKAKKDDRMSRTRSSGMAKSIRSNHSRGCPTVRVVS